MSDHGMACGCETCVMARVQMLGVYERTDGTAFTLLQVIARALFCWTSVDREQIWFDVAQERENDRLFACGCSACLAAAGDLL